MDYIKFDEELKKLADIEFIELDATLQKKMRSVNLRKHLILSCHNR